MQVKSAVNYGYRTVIVVCHNPDEAEYLHSDGSAHPVNNVHGCMPGAGEPHICTVNHRLEEFIWDGDEQFIDGVRRDANSYWEELCQRCVSLPTPSEIEGLVGRSS